MMAKTANDTTIAGTRLEAARGAPGRLSGCVSLSDVSATSVPYGVSLVARFFHREIYKKNEPSRGRSSDGSCAIANPKSTYIMGLYNDQLASSLLAWLANRSRLRFLCDRRP